MKKSYAELREILGKQRVKTNEPIAPYTYIKIGGPADLFFIATNITDLTKAVKAAIRLVVPYVVLGGGSNILVSDLGFRGLVIKNRADKISIKRYRGKIQGKKLAVTDAKVEAESGAITNHLVRYTIQEGLSGLEYFLGIPGTVGGAIYNNAHYKDQQIGSLVDEVKVISKNGKERIYQRKQMKFSYDSSILQKTGELITTVTFHLPGGDSRALWKKAEALARQRSATQPLNLPSSGCMFKNLKQDSRKTRLVESYSAGWFIDKAGLKGLRVGGAIVSEKHANFIVNTGGATANDVLKLSELVRSKVRHQFGITLDLEVFKIGVF